MTFPSLAAATMQPLALEGTWRRVIIISLDEPAVVSVEDICVHPATFPFFWPRHAVSLHLDCWCCCDAGWNPGRWSGGGFNWGGVQVTASPAIPALIDGKMGSATLPRSLYLKPGLWQCKPSAVALSQDAERSKKSRRGTSCRASRCPG